MVKCILCGRDWLVLLLFSVVTFALYAPVLGNGFLTDDYASLYRILVERELLHHELLRPLIDLSFYLNYIFSGLHPAGYYVFNFCIHILTCFMVYRVAYSLRLFEDRRHWFALLSGFIFAFYPFHNEPVIWLSGRLSSMAALCGLGAIYCSLNMRAPWNFLWPALLMFVGLFAYESILVLPLIILVLREDLSRSRKSFLRAAVAWATVVVLCLAVRFWLAGTLMPDYVRGNLAARGAGGFLSRLLKATGRCFLPPSELTGLMTIFFVVVGMVVILLHFRLWKRRGDGVFVSRYTRLAAAFAVAMAAAVMSGVSTRTSEGDRLLYFASCFLSMLAAALLLVLVDKKWIWWSLAVVYLTSSVYFIEENNGRWRTASGTAAVILDSLKASPASHTVLINAPDEWEGAYIFRNNFDRALSINGIPPAGVFVNNNLMRLDYLPVKGRIDVSGSGDSLWIYPETKIIRKDGVVEIGNTRTGVVKAFPLQGLRLYYWDKIQLKRVDLQ